MQTLHGYRVHYTCDLFPGRRIAIRIVMPRRIDVTNLGHRHVKSLTNIIADASDEREDEPLPDVEIFKIEYLGNKQGEWNEGFCALLDNVPHLKKHRSHTSLLNAIEAVKLRMNPGIPKKQALMRHNWRVRTDNAYRKTYSEAIKRI